MLNSKIDTLLFDLDNTLIDRNTAMRKTMQQWLTEINCNAKAVEIALGEIMQKDDWGYMNRLDFSAWVVKNYGGNDSRIKDGKFFYHYTLENIVKYLEPNEAIISLLNKLSNKFRLVIATNGEAIAQRRKLEKAGLLNCFKPENIFISANVGVEKPDKKFFEIIMHDLKISPAQALMIGDSPVNDIQCSKNAGLNNCWVSYNRINTLNPTPDIIIDRITDLNESLIT